jgi:hypothetical protein
MPTDVAMAGPSSGSKAAVVSETTASAPTEQPTAASNPQANSRPTIYIALFALTFIIFALSPVTDLHDSRYTILLSECILTRHSNDLKGYSIEGLDPASLPSEPDLVRNDAFYELVKIDGKLLYYYPHGSSILSMPLVAALRASGRSVVNDAGNYYVAREAQEQHLIAAVLMALLACLFLRTASVLLPLSWSLAIAFGASLGSQIWSTASRLLWSHTWEVLLLGAVTLGLLEAEDKRRPLPMISLASLVAWMFFVRPTGGIVVAGVTIYILLYYRIACLPYLLTGLIWLVAFITYSWFTFDEILPGYYHNSSFHSSEHFFAALAGDLISPSRGLLVFVPELTFLIYLVVRFWKRMPHRRLATLAVAMCFAHTMVLAADKKWWGGWSYGPRLSTDLVPWFVLLAILAIRARRDQMERTGLACGPGELRSIWRLRIEIAIGCMLVVAGIAINARGALSWSTTFWNAEPNIELHPERVWDWRAPQFLAGVTSRRP